MLSNVIVFCTAADKIDQAREFAEHHQLVFSDKPVTSSSLILNFDDEIPTLYDTDNQNNISINFTSGTLAHRLQYGGGKGQTIAKAIGVSSKNKPHVLDATAGLGRDALVLANLGCKMTLVEQSPILAEMLLQAKQQAESNPQFQQATKAGFDIYNNNADEFMQQRIIADADVVYLDPMYPENKKSALVKKDMQILQKMLGHSSEDEIACLLDIAVKFAKQRVVVKRPKGAKPIRGIAPTMSLNSKKTRYDVYVIKALKLNEL